MLIAQRPVISSEQIGENRYQFTIDSLEPGFGYTLGNSLRRTLLSSIPGAAVTSIKIAGAQHEFETIEGVKEDVTNIILNIKNLVISSIVDSPVVIFLHKEEAGEVTAADIKTSAGVEVLNKDLHLATLSKGYTLDIEFVVERGRGYVSADINKTHLENPEHDRIAVDSIYSPVLKVTYKVEATRVGNRTDFDKLILDVETKPSISPVDAVASAGKTLVELFGLVRDLNENVEGVELGAAPVLEPELVEEEPITSLNLKTRSFNSLDRAGIKTINQLLTYTETTLKSVDSLGPSSVAEIIAALDARGLKLDK
jgi:DNA-directed RNA polymerase subunit alpha